MTTSTSMKTLMAMRGGESDLVHIHIHIHIHMHTHVSKHAGRCGVGDGLPSGLDGLLDTTESILKSSRS
jgi:hypothetical protein